MDLNGQFILCAIGAALLIVIVGQLQNWLINLITAPLVGVIAMLVPSGLTEDMSTNRLLWVVASLVVLGYLEYTRQVEMDWSRPLVVYRQRSAARRTIRSEVRRAKIEPARNFSFEVENG